MKALLLILAMCFYGSLSLACGDAACNGGAACESASCEQAKACPHSCHGKNHEGTADANSCPHHSKMKNAKNQKELNPPQKVGVLEGPESK